MIKMVPVASSNVEAIGYDGPSKTMHVRFKGGGTYLHHNVSAADHAAFASASSHGKHYHAHFKGKHSSKL